MNIFSRYIAYLKDNQEGYWFKRKIFGWGWTPATWQGWLVTLVFLGAVILFALTIDESSSGKEMVFTFFLPVAILTSAFLRIAYKRGEKPKWQWGIKGQENIQDVDKVNDPSV